MNLRTPADALSSSFAGPSELALTTLRFDEFEFDLDRSELRRSDGTPIALRPKTEILLRLFLGQPGRLLSREELMDSLWPSTVVTDDSLVQCVGDLRSTLDDRAQRLIKTVQRRGYRLEATVLPVGAATAAAPTPTEPLASSSGPRRSGRSRDRPPTMSAISLLGGLVIATGAAVWLRARPVSTPATRTSAR